jgi:5-methylcytosine-specific restriction enzyme A
MPSKPRHPCRQPGCPALTNDTYCPAHAREHQRTYDAARGTAEARGYTARWRKRRRIFLAEHPLCEECRRAGKVVAASVVDHVVPHRGDLTLFWDEANWQALCERHHNQKTATEDGGFGRGTAPPDTAGARPPQVDTGDSGLAATPPLPGEILPGLPLKTARPARVRAAISGVPGLAAGDSQTTYPPRNEVDP